jgi:hypothetical protein
VAKLNILAAGITALSFGPFIFLKHKRNPVLENHETIHFFQQLELLFVFQWLLYAVFYVAGLIRYRDRQTAYYSNPFEKEAYTNQRDMNYIEERPWFNWIRYLK